MRSPSIHEPSLPAGSVGRQTGLGRIGRASIAPEMSATGTMRRGKLPPHLFRMSISKAGHGEHDAETGLNLNKKLSLGHLGPDDMDDDADIWSGSTDELSLYSMGSYSSVYVPRTFQLFAEYHGHSFPVRVLSHGSVADAIQSIMIDLCHYLETSGSNISESISISDQNKAQFRLCKLERYSPGVRTWMDPAHVLGTYDFMSGDEVRLKHVEDIERTCVIVPPSSVRHTLEYGFDAVVKDVVAKLREEHVGNKEEKYGLYYPRYGIWLEDGKTLFSYDLQPEHHLELRALANQFLLRIYLPQFDQKIALKALPNLRTSDVIAMIHYQLSNRKLTLSGRGRYNLFLPSQNLWLKESATLEDYKTIATEDVQYKLQYELVLVTLQVPTLEKTPPLRLLIDSTTTVETLIQSVGLRNPGHLDGGYCIYSPAGDRLNEKELVWTAAKDLTDADSLQYRAVPHRVNLSNTFDRNVRIDVDIDFALALERSVKFMCRRFGVDRSLLKAVWTETGSVLDLGLSLDAQSVFAGTKLVLDISPPVTVRSRNPTDATDDSVPIWEESDSPDNLQLTKDNQGVLVVASGTLNKLVERLTDEMGEGTSQYLDYVKTFLLTYQSFTTGSVLLRKLMERYHAPRDRKPTWASYDHFRLTIQLRVCNVLLQWVKRHPSDFVSQKDKEVHPFWHTAMEFVETVLAWDHANMARQIRRNLVKIKDRSHPGLVKHHIIKSSPKFGEHERTGGVWRYGSEEIARQLTILEHGYFADILPSELLNQSWSKGDASEKAPNIIKLTRRFNAVACWCAKVWIFSFATTCVYPFANPHRRALFFMIISILTVHP
ncbi:ras guanine nucleotide exchange factor domain-containing protein [Gaertneriomyces semiglobifer]|nr:ras guanine nucleotide exchange factor domain-containing protein [Gaertneriomyces semiglobifer]